jgi:hypothetical protein
MLQEHERMSVFCGLRHTTNVTASAKPSAAIIDPIHF